MQKLLTWLNAHPLIKIRELERDCGIPQAALAKALKGDTKYLSEKHLPKLKEVLKGYGYKAKQKSEAEKEKALFELWAFINSAIDVNTGTIPYDDFIGEAKKYFK